MPLPDISSLNSYGGAIANYSPVVDATTDEDALFRNRYACDAAMMSRIACKCAVSIIGVDGGNPTDPVTGFIHEAMWGSTAGIKPLKVRSGEGVYDLTWPGSGHSASTVSDELTAYDAALGGGITHTLNFRRAVAQVQCSDGTLRHAVAEVTAANVVRVRCFLANGTADDLAGQVITVWVW